MYDEELTLGESVRLPASLYKPAKPVKPVGYFKAAMYFGAVLAVTTGLNAAFPSQDYVSKSTSENDISVLVEKME